MARGKTYILLGIFLYLLAGAPIWWKLTKIQRPNLPHDGMQGILTSITVGFKLPIKIHIILHFRHSERFANVVLEQVSSRLLLHRETSPQVEKGMHVHVITGTNATDCMCLTWRSQSVMHGSSIQGAEAAASVRGEADCLAMAVGILGDMAAMLRPGGSSLQELSAADEQPVHPDKLMERLHSLRDEPGTYFLIVSSMTSSFAIHDTPEASPEGPAAELIIGSQRAAVLTLPQIVHPDSDTMLSIQRHVLRNALDRTVPILAAAFWQDYGELC
ncbi:hypothetical protein CEUSTIGMA_g7442.t1 [Chlamydomonas eustigma]|uniref:Uncharacterized protein n=1 Tax=Chlamydomonas eustigma TaxID=1157962 RepID=A0A250XAV6_9CHLO|nr:hypothetical protein CEUSTIGMA_g7442.t1 [Chlamydomonas eustigma]|eukprot:GAX80002.1 hypothetical protein CEUSTIGMA_g7442.t1 [Chlamydomonas eustigma]